jgi:intraflagellar transport protein 81
MEEENKVNAYLVKEKYPKEIESYKQKLKDCEVVASKTVMSQSEMTEIKKRIDEDLLKDEADELQECI